MARQRRYTAEEVALRILDLNSDDDSEIESDTESVQLNENEVFLIPENNSPEESSDDEDPDDEYEPPIQVGGVDWHRQPIGGGREPNRNIVTATEYRFTAGVRPNSPVEAFLLFWEDDIEDMVRFTNLEARRIIAKPTTANSVKDKWYPVDSIEMKAFIGLHISAGVNKQNMTSVERLWDVKRSSPIFAATMTRERFDLIRRFFRNDDRLRRDRNDRLSPVRSLFDQKLAQFQQIYRCGPHCTIDEQLLRFHGRLAFRMYIPSKPEKYGVKIFWIVDNDSGYIMNGLVYIGQSTFTDKPFEEIESIRDRTSMVLCAPIFNMGVNVTMDNWFTSIQLANLFSQKRTTLVGTLRFNSRGVPPEAKLSANRARGSTSYFYSTNMTLLSYKDRKPKPILFLSSQHRQSRDVEGKPEIVAYYNATKSGVDTMDHKLSLTSSVRKSRRWTYTFLFNLLDVSLINAHILYNKVSGRVVPRVEFLDAICDSLCKPQMQRRVAKKKSLETKLALEIFQIRAPPIPAEKKRGRCKLCNDDRKYTSKCGICGSFSCKEHGSFIHNTCI